MRSTARHSSLARRSITTASAGCKPALPERNRLDRCLFGGGKSPTNLRPSTAFCAGDVAALEEPEGRRAEDKCVGPQDENGVEQIGLRPLGTAGN